MEFERMKRAPILCSYTTTMMAGSHSVPPGKITQQTSTTSPTLSSLKGVTAQLRPDQPSRATHRRLQPQPASASRRLGRRGVDAARCDSAAVREAWRLLVVFGKANVRESYVPVKPYAKKRASSDKAGPFRL